MSFWLGMYGGLFLLLAIIVMTLGTIAINITLDRAADRAEKARCALAKCHKAAIYQSIELNAQNMRAWSSNSYARATTADKPDPGKLVELMKATTEKLRAQGYTVNCTIKTPVITKL